MPTHFVAVRVANPDVLLNFETYLNYITTVQADLESCFCSLQKSHVTLMTLDIPVGKEEETINCFNEVVSIKRGLLEETGLEFSFEGVCLREISSGNQMIYSPAIVSKGLNELNLLLHSLETAFSCIPHVIARRTEFLHVTLLNTKIGRLARRGRNPQIELDVYQPFALHDFGSQRADSLQFLNMKRGADRKANDYYKIESEVDFLLLN